MSMPALSWFVAVSAAITASCSVSMLGVAWAMWRTQQQHDRALFGAEGIDSWDGLIVKVAEHREALEERGDL